MDVREVRKRCVVWKKSQYYCLFWNKGDLSISTLRSDTMNENASYNELSVINMFYDDTIICLLNANLIEG